MSCDDFIFSTITLLLHTSSHHVSYMYPICITVHKSVSCPCIPCIPCSIGRASRGCFEDGLRPRLSEGSSGSCGGILQMQCKDLVEPCFGCKDWCQSIPNDSGNPLEDSSLSMRQQFPVTVIIVPVASQTVSKYVKSCDFLHRNESDSCLLWKS